MRPTISPIRPRCTPSGLTRTRVFSLLGTVEQPTGPLDQDHRALCTLEHAQRAMIKKVRQLLLLLLSDGCEIVLPSYCTWSIHSLYGASGASVTMKAAVTSESPWHARTVW